MKIDLYGDGIGSVELVSSMGTDLSVVNAARVSFGVEHDKLDEKDEKLINYLVEHKHTSPLEHCVLTYKCVVPLFVRSQHMRHRTNSFNEISRRYQSDNLQFYCPKEFREQHESNRQASNPKKMIDPVFSTTYDGYEYMCSQEVRDHTMRAAILFNKLIDKGICREQARIVLPQNLYTEYFCTANLSNLLKFIELRSHEGAQWEIQKVAEAVKTIALTLWPVTVEAFDKRSWK